MKNYLTILRYKIFNHTLLKAILLCTLLPAISLPVLAQRPEKGPGEIVICPAGKKDTHTKVLPKGMKSAEDMRLQQNRSLSTATFEVTFGPGAELNTAAKEAFFYALDIWSREIASEVPVKVYVDIGLLDFGVVAAAGPSFSVRNFSGAPLPDVYYPAALANALAGTDLYPDEPYDLEVKLGSGYRWYFGQDTNIPSGYYHFITVALHEIGHGLGFTGIRGYESPTGTGTIRSNDSYSIFSEKVELSDGTPITSLPDPSVALGDALTSGAIYQAGPQTRAGLNNSRPPLYAPSSYQGGSSYAHWDESAFPAGNPNSLMTPRLGSAEANFDIGDITRGLFQDMGWELSTASMPQLSVSPETLYEEIDAGSNRMVAIELTNISDASQTFAIRTDPAAGWLSADPASGSLVAGESRTLQVTLSSAGLAKGLYEGSLLFDDGDPATSALPVPVTMRVLDGTEAPAIDVGPALLTQKIATGTTSSQMLQVTNVGDDTLEYTISIDIPEGAGREPKTLYATGFEDFPYGDIDDKNGWVCNPPFSFLTQGKDPYEGMRHLSTIFASNRPSNAVAISPATEAGTNPYSYVSFYLKITGPGSTQQFSLSNSENKASAFLTINREREISIYDEKFKGSVGTGIYIPEEYFKLGLSIDRDTRAMDLLMNDSVIYSGVTWAPLIERLRITTRFIGPDTSLMTLDNLEIMDGQPGRGFIHTYTKKGKLAPGEADEIDITFDARLTNGLGTSTANIVINSNDPANPEVRVPAELQVVNPPTAMLSPEDLGDMRIDVLADNPPKEVKQFTLTNTGDLPLTYSAFQGGANFAPDYMRGDPLAGLNMSLYGQGNTIEYEESSALASGETIRPPEDNTIRNRQESQNLFDSIYYDTGRTFPTDFSGVYFGSYATAMRYEVPDRGFALSAVRNAYRTEELSDPVIIMEIRRGGDLPQQGELVYTTTIKEAAPEGTFRITDLRQSIYFEPGEHFWVVHKYPEGISFPQGFDPNAEQRENTYFFSETGGLRYWPGGFAYLQRALSGTVYEYISLEPGSGEVQPGETVNITATFNASELPNGTYHTPVIFNTNDPT